MKAKIYEGTRYLGQFTCDGRKYTRMQYIKLQITRTVKKSLITASILVIGGWLFTAGVLIAKATIEPSVAYADRVVEVPVKEIPPILERIMDCESGERVNGKPVKGSRTHLDKNGQVITNSNGNSTDVGIAQINTYYHGKKATEMGLNLMVEEDNIKFAIWLFENEGSVPWSPSASCWLR